MEAEENLQESEDAKAELAYQLSRLEEKQGEMGEAPAAVIDHSGGASGFSRFFACFRSSAGVNSAYGHLEEGQPALRSAEELTRL